MNKEKNKDKESDTYSIIAILLILFSFAWIVTVFTMDLSEYNEIGDAFTGLTAPIISFVSALLIYLSFKAQIKANEKIQEQIDKTHQQTNFEFLNIEFKDLKEDIAKFYHRKINRGIGVEAMYEVTNLLKNYFSQNETTKEDLDISTMNLENLFFQFQVYLNQIDSLNITEEHRKVFYTKTTVFYLNGLHIIIDNVNKLETSDKTTKVDNLTLMSLTSVSKEIHEKMESVQELAFGN